MINKPLNCPVCNKPMQLAQRNEQLVYKGASIKIVSPYYKCECHKAGYSTDEMDDKTIKLLKKVYRKYFKKKK
jgi:C4-type Zn-finger protein